MDDSRQPERRRHRRVVTDTRVDVIFADHTSDAGARARNASEGGLFLAADELFSDGTELGIGLRPLADRPPLRARVVVVWSRAVPAGPERLRGMGVRLVELDEEGRDTLRTLAAPPQASEPQAEAGDAPTASGQLPLDFFAGGVAAERDLDRVDSVGPADEEEGDAPPTTLSSEVGGQVPFTLTFEEEEDGGAAKGAATRRLVLQLAVAAAGVAVVAVVLWILWPRGGARPPAASLGADLPVRTAVVAPLPLTTEAPTAVPSPGEAGSSAAPTPEARPEPSPRAAAVQPTEPPAAVSAVSTAVVLGGASKVVNVSWREEGGAEVLTVRGNHPLASQQVLVQVLPEPARCLVRLSGIEEPFSRDRLRVGMALVRGIRIGWHRDASPRELHLVLDLASDAVDVESTVAGDTLTVRLVAR